MAKRKAKDLGDEIPPEEPRRSSRRVSTAKEEVAPEKKPRPAPPTKTGKKVQKPTKEVSTAVNINSENGKTADTVGAAKLLSIPTHCISSQT
jgi:hypothetical protein